MIDYPAWATPGRRRLAYLIRLAALRHNDSGNIYVLSKAVGRHRNFFHFVIRDGLDVPAEVAVALEELTGCPREEFAPGVFKGLTRAE